MSLLRRLLQRQIEFLLSFYKEVVEKFPTMSITSNKVSLKDVVESELNTVDESFTNKYFKI